MHARFHPTLLVVSLTRIFHAENEKRIEAFGLLARNLPGIARNLLGMRAEIARTSHARNSLTVTILKSREMI